jgi:hypothetical protein
MVGAFARYGRSGFAVRRLQSGRRKFDGEVTTARFLRRCARWQGWFLSNGYHSDDAVRRGAGATLRLNRWFALAGDVSSLLEKRAGEEVAWDAGLQIAIPYSPHSLSLQVTNTNTATLQGVSRGIDQVRGGFEFTIPFTLSRYFGRRGEAAASTAARAAKGRRMQRRADARHDVRSTAPRDHNRNNRALTNNDPVVHTVTADDKSWDSAAIEPGQTWCTRSHSPVNSPSIARRIRS